MDKTIKIEKDPNDDSSVVRTTVITQTQKEVISLSILKKRLSNAQAVVDDITSQIAEAEALGVKVEPSVAVSDPTII